MPEAQSGPKIVFLLGAGASVGAGAVARVQAAEKSDGRTAPRLIAALHEDVLIRCPEAGPAVFMMRRY
jgi:hypothetical protein